MFARTFPISVTGKSLIIKAIDANLPIQTLTEELSTRKSKCIDDFNKNFWDTEKTRHGPMHDALIKEKLVLINKSINFSCWFFLSFALRQHYV